MSDRTKALLLIVSVLAIAIAIKFDVLRTLSLFILVGAVPASDISIPPRIMTIAIIITLTVMISITVQKIIASRAEANKKYRLPKRRYANLS